jgi:hypothetical protein
MCKIFWSGRLSDSPGPDNLYRLLHRNPGLDGTGEKRKKFIAYQIQKRRGLQ